MTKPRTQAADLLHLTLELPEPPTVNDMLGMARRTTRKGPGGGFMRKPQTVYWVRQVEYHDAARVALAVALKAAGVPMPREPWPRWRIVAAHYRVHQLRDPLELPAGLKWAADALVAAGLVADDSPRELETPPAPTQAVDRAHRGVTLVVQPLPDLTLTREAA